MKELFFNCETITPMFIAGADPKKAELRAPSLKGALRFWWRAVNGHLDINELSKQETALFGGGGDNARKSRFSITIDPVTAKPDTATLPFKKIIAQSKGKQFPVNILDYLAFGPAEYVKGSGTVITKEYYPVGTPFTVRLSFFELPVADQQALTDLMYMIAWFGGLGSKTRNGFGRFQIKKTNVSELPELHLPASPEKLFDKYLNKAGTDSPVRKYTAFSGNAYLLSGGMAHPNWHDALAELGKAYRTARMGLEKRHDFEKRMTISAPIIEGKAQRSKLERHAKPLFLSVVRNQKGFASYILFLPYEYGSSIPQFKTPAEKRTAQDTYFDAIEGLMELLEDNNFKVV